MTASTPDDDNSVDYGENDFLSCEVASEDESTEVNLPEGELLESFQLLKEVAHTFDLRSHIEGQEKAKTIGWINEYAETNYVSIQHPYVPSSKEEGSAKQKRSSHFT